MIHDRTRAVDSALSSIQNEGDPLMDFVKLVLQYLFAILSAVVAAIVGAQWPH